MFVLIWAALLLSVRGSNAAEAGSFPGGKEHCAGRFCITLSEGEITAQAGLCVVIPCSFTTAPDFEPTNMIWYKCEPSKRCGVADIIFQTDNNNNRVQSAFKGRVSLLEPDVSLKNCSIIINDLTGSDSGSYQLRVNGYKNWRPDGFTFTQRATVSVKGLMQKPTLMIPPLTEGQQTTLTCTALGFCSGSKPKITWTWRGARENDSHITGNITAFNTEDLTAVTQRHSSTLTFNSSAEHHGTEVTCEVSFTGDMTTEETVTLNVTSDQCGPHAVLPWAVAAVSLIVNVCCIICVSFLWNSRKKAKPNQEDRTYMTLQKTEPSPEYDVIGQPLN